MTASIQDARLQQRFELWDKNGDGKVDKADWDSEARRIIKAFGETDGSPKGRALLGAYEGMWAHYAGAAGVPLTASLSKPQFVKVAQDVVSGGEQGFAKALRPTVEAMVNLADTDGDGEVNPVEFKRWLTAIGVDASDADRAFRQIDTDGNGQLTVQELVNSVKDYHAGRSDVSLLGQ